MAEAPRRQPTLDEVAERAGVSRTAASRVLNNAPHVSKAKRDAVERAIRELGYIPNATARALATRRAGAVALAITDDDSALGQDTPFYSQAIAGVTTVLEETGLELMLVLVNSPRSRSKLQDVLQTHSAAGIMLMGRHGDDPLAALAEQADMPVVFGGRPLNFEPRFYVDSDNRGGARAATEHLIARGRNRIAAITGPLDSDAGVARHRGFLDAMAVAGLPATRVAHGDYTEASGTQAMQALLEQHPDLDAVVAGNDTMAISALRVLAATGRRVPDDVALTGFDDYQAARHTTPPLTTVHQSIPAWGREMARMLLAVIDGEQPSPLILPARLIVRESS
jgi:DNA-binding LacI/PurR family transcriptional regulator